LTMSDASRARTLILIFGFVGPGARRAARRLLSHQSERRLTTDNKKSSRLPNPLSNAKMTINVTDHGMSSRSLLRSTTSSNMPRGIARPECLASTRRRINDGTRGALRQIRWHARPRPGTHTRTRARPPSLPPHVSLGHAGVRCCENREVRGHPARSDSAKLIVARVEFPRLTRPPSPHPRRLV
jgi:hypothetical protein